jgi:hypothetical protein
MALDFCIGQESAPPVFSLPEHMHIQLFVRTDELRRWPQLGRMSNFHADVSYEAAGLLALLQELQQVIPAFAGRPQMQATLQQLRDVCQTAIMQERGLYGFCD